MTATLDRTFAAALRRELVVRASASSPRPWWRRRRALAGTGLAVALVVAGGAASVALDGVLPGGNRVAPLTQSASVTATGTITVDLGPRPDGATLIDMEVVCLTPGTIGLSPEGASVSCSAADVGTPHAGARWTPELPPGRTTWTFTAAPDVSYQVVARYASATQTPWGVNAHGDTYGVAKAPVGGGGPVVDADIPDLVAVMATNGRQGYAWKADLAWGVNGGGQPPRNPDEALAGQAENAGTAFAIPVYESDGTTEIGEFVIGEGQLVVYPDGHTRPAVAP